jgi:DNA-binding NarL/FixJ family response regulator
LEWGTRGQTAHADRSRGRARRAPGEEELTARELEGLTLIRDGCKNKQIADQLTISENTVNFHIKNVVDKLGAKDRTHAVAIAIRRGLLPV